MLPQLSTIASTPGMSKPQKACSLHAWHAAAALLVNACKREAPKTLRSSVQTHARACAQVALIDLDFKAARKIPRHAALDAEVLATAAQHTELLDQVLDLTSEESAE